jgi:dipeptidase
VIAPLPCDVSVPWPVWVSFGTPCTGVFLPVYINGVIPAALARGAELPEEDSAWWEFQRLREAASVDNLRTTPLVREGWREIEEWIESERIPVENAARLEAEAGHSERAAEVVTAFMDRVVAAAHARERELGEQKQQPQ